MQSLKSIRLAEVDKFFKQSFEQKKLIPLYIIESKVQWIPFWLATQQYPHNDWLGGNFPYTMAYAHGPHLNFLRIAIDENGFRRMKEEGQIYKRLPQNF